LTRQRHPEIKENLIFRPETLPFGERSVANVAGLLAALMSINNPALHNTPGRGVAALAGYGATFGLGALLLSPEHARLIARVRRGLNSGHRAAVAHLLDTVQTTTHRCMPPCRF